jgi:hypothetical protein
LSEAKSFHDDFEVNRTVCIAPFQATIRQYPGELEKLAAAVETFVQTEKTIVKKRSPDYTVDASSALASQQVPSSIRENAVNIKRAYQQLARALVSYRESLDKVKDFSNDQNYGVQFRTTTSFLADQAHQVVLQADEIILNSVPIISFLHYETRKALTSLL